MKYELCPLGECISLSPIHHCTWVQQLWQDLLKARENKTRDTWLDWFAWVQRCRFLETGEQEETRPQKWDEIQILILEREERSYNSLQGWCARGKLQSFSLNHFPDKQLLLCYTMTPCQVIQLDQSEITQQQIKTWPSGSPGSNFK